MPSGMTVLQAPLDSLGVVAARHIMDATFGPQSSLYIGPTTPCLALAGGRTMTPVNEALTPIYDERLRGARITHLDEYVFPSRIFPERNAAVSMGEQLRREVLGPALGKSKGGWPNVHLIDPYGKPREEAEKHSKFVRESGGMTTVILGLGGAPDLGNYFGPREVLKRFFSDYTGDSSSPLLQRTMALFLFSVHLAFNEANADENSGIFSEKTVQYFAALGSMMSTEAYLHPDKVPFSTRSFVTRLHPSTIQANGVGSLGIRQAVTMGLGAILCAQHIFLVAMGENKALPLWLALMGPITPLVPASALQLAAKRVTVIADEAALRYIPSKHVRTVL